MRASLSWDLSFESSTKKPGYIQGWTPGYIQGWTPTDLLVNKNLFPSYVSWWPLELDGKLLKARNLYCALRFFSINLKIFQLNITFEHVCVCVSQYSYECSFSMFQSKKQIRYGNWIMSAIICAGKPSLDSSLQNKLLSKEKTQCRIPIFSHLQFFLHNTYTCLLSNNKHDTFFLSHCIQQYGVQNIGIWYCGNSSPGHKLQTVLSSVLLSQ